MLEFLYAGTYWEHAEDKRGILPSEKLYKRYVERAEPRTDEQKERDPVMVNVRMFALADKFGIAGLKKEVMKKWDGYAEECLEQRPSAGKTTVGMERRARAVMGSFQRLMDAAEVANDLVPGSELAEKILRTVAQVAPWVSRLQNAEKYKELMVRLGGNSELALRMFDLTCRASDEFIQVQSQRQDRIIESKLAVRETGEKIIDRLHAAACDHSRFRELRCPPHTCSRSRVGYRANVAEPAFDEDDGVFQWCCKNCDESWDADEIMPGLSDTQRASSDDDEDDG
ncbi:hypothetical protein BJ508DRAFT_181626 [Ascobolus immersus RN42]|uniref:BTB domain-containing protein n=1 Tax=Ascobolus immersus RN42 TaxID=1160509 RepID=A0A3N4HXW9_ASCIM|nr:hypothetical protein BJ508DRAFT_181626 [Ascobolus immersus RN42]